MPKIKLILFFTVLIVNSLAKGNTPLLEDPELASIFNKHKSVGTIILSSLDTDTTYVYNVTRANERLSPASTFKIANSIIALEANTIKDQDEIIKWDGQQRMLASWNCDQNLSSAFKSSCVWFYQNLATKIGFPTYNKYLANFAYGNKLAADNITTFWLANGSLQITPLEQVAFLEKIYHKQLPIASRTYDILQEIMLEEENCSYTIYAKTGAATENWQGHGWYVGYVISNNQAWAFATNIIIKNQDDLPKRKAITIAALKQKLIL